MSGHGNRFGARVEQDGFKTAPIIAVNNPTQQLEAVPMGEARFLLEKKPLAPWKVAGDASVHGAALARAKVDGRGCKEVVGRIT